MAWLPSQINMWDIIFFYGMFEKNINTSVEKVKVMHSRMFSNKCRIPHDKPKAHFVQPLENGKIFLEVLEAPGLDNPVEFN